MASSTDLPTSPKDLLIANHDVLVLIFKLFIPPVAVDTPKTRFTRGGRKQLLNLALTCKAFVDPALECLWSHLESLEPLFKRHPGLKKVGNSYLFRGDINAQSSSGYHEYVGKVRTVSFRDSSGSRSNYRIASAGYAWLGQQLQGAPLLPGLRSIHFKNCPADSHHLGLLPLMLSPFVDRVEFGNMFLSSPIFDSYALPLVCDASGLPSLRELILSDHASSGTINPGIWNTLAGMSTRLQSLTLRFPRAFVLQPDTLHRLAQQLQSLTALNLDAHVSSHGPSRDIQGQVLPLLHTLHLVNRSGPSLCECYPPFLLQKATSVTFSLTGSVDDDNAFSRSLDTLSSVESLRRVEVKGPNQLYINVGSIAPFLRHLQLEELHLQEVWGLRQEEDERTAHGIVQGMFDGVNNSRLRFLSLPIWRSVIRNHHNRYHYFIRPNYHPVHCLLYLAQHAKGLQHVSLSIDSNARGLNNETLASMIQSWSCPDTPSKLRYLEIAEMRDPGRSFTPHECRDIARLLDTIFPNLMSVIMIKEGQRPTQWDELWQLIEEHRQMLKSLRLYRENRW